MISSDFEADVFAVCQPIFRTAEYARQWMKRPIPAFKGKTPVEYAREHGLSSLREHLDRIFHYEVTA